jgi:hypothetical protein
MGQVLIIHGIFHLANSDAGGNIADQDPQMASQSLINQGLETSCIEFHDRSRARQIIQAVMVKTWALFDASGSLNWSNSNMSRIPSWSA